MSLSPIAAVELTSAAAGARATRAPAARRTNSIAHIVHELWDARDLVVQFTRRDITVRYAQAVMGFAWALFMPILIVGAGLVLRVVVSNVSKTQSGMSDVGSLLVKSLPWAFFSAALSTATQSVLAYASLIGKVKFPREALPIASVAAQGVDLVIGALFAAAVLPFLGVSASWSLLWVPVVLVLLVAFTVGCSLLLSCANLFYRDVKYIVQVVLQFGVFATPVFFAPELLPLRFRAVMLRLPLTPYIQGLDLCVTRGHNLLHALVVPTSRGPTVVWSPWMLAYAVLLPLVTVGVGLRVFRRASARFAEMA